MVKIAPSILAADFTNLADEINKITKAGADILHLDVMDGHFVPNLSFGFPVIKQIRQITDLPLDVHLMVTNPEMYIEPLSEIGVQYISFHPETVYHLDRLVNQIQVRGIQAGLAINPGTPIGAVESIIDMLDFVLLMSVNPGFGGQKFIKRTLDKIDQLNKLKVNVNESLLIEIDGGVDNKTSTELIARGVDLLVAGSYIFKGNYKDRIESIRE